ncbi:MAG TPA: DUF4398 domain-containing protein [Azospirillum sp.]|nr:DUF4398 domain-containing protein [Azospirillum sp.]
MERYRTIVSRRMLAVLAPFALAACAGDPVPRAELGAAEQAIQNAEQAGAPQFAPVELELARSKMTAARQAAGDDRETQARLLAQEARADANYAAAKARAGAAERAAAVASRDWNALSGGARSGSSGAAARQGAGADSSGATSWGGANPQPPSGTMGGLR